MFTSITRLKERKQKGLGRNVQDAAREFSCLNTKTDEPAASVD